MEWGEKESGRGWGDKEMGRGEKRREGWDIFLTGRLNELLVRVSSDYIQATAR